MYTNELCHHGVKGQKWGVRRYQNSDGTLTSKGKARYARDAREKEFNKYDSESGKYYKESKKNGRTDLESDAKRYAKEDIERTKRLVDSGRNLSNDLKRSVDTSSKHRNVQKMDLSNMTDQELRNQINRAMLERQYNDMFNPQNESRGREYASRTLETAGNVLAVTNSALGVALAIKELRG
jgi:1,4-alpha-glucan branching enzyme